MSTLWVRKSNNPETTQALDLYLQDDILKLVSKVTYWVAHYTRRLYTFTTGKLEWYTDNTRFLADLIVRKLVGILLMALLTALTISSVIQYLQVYAAKNLRL